MALNETFAHATRGSVAFLITQDGNPGTTMTLNNNDFVGSLSGSGLGGPLLKLLSTDFAANSQALQRAVLLGDASGLGASARNLSEFPYCEVQVEQRTGAAGWLVDADTDAGATARGKLNITGPAGVATALITLKFCHTYVR